MSLSRGSLTLTQRHNISGSIRRSSTARHTAPTSSPHNDQGSKPNPYAEKKDAEPAPLGPLAQRLQDATEEALFTGGRRGRQAITDAGFSPELRDALLAKLAAADMTTPQPLTGAASAAASMPAAADRGARDTALMRPWTGQEERADGVLRMLNDAHKQLAPELRAKPPGAGAGAGVVVNLRPRRAQWLSPGQRVTHARDAAAEYAVSQGAGAARATAVAAEGEESERDERRRMFKERFEPGTRALPHSVSGLASLANERIEAAMARGAFDGIPRGPGVQRDERGSNPFIDTTEYIMNNMIKRQDLAPPWIDKQQEITRATGVFRSRLRSSWKRRLVALIAERAAGRPISRGAVPTLEEQIVRARRNARAEARCNPPRGPARGLGAVAAGVTDDVVMRAGMSGTSGGLAGQDTGETDVYAGTRSDTDVAQDNKADTDTDMQPLRDPNWEQRERRFIELSVAELNALMRSYNLLAPDLAKKAYFSVDGELRTCYAEVAGQVEGALREQAVRPTKRTEPGFGIGLGDLFTKGISSSSDGAGRLEDSRKEYGLKDMWRDLWKR
ncbi:hypothetical protein BROUX41_003300 [Berkeleyomyces rouxiae]